MKINNICKKKFSTKTPSNRKQTLEPPVISFITDAR